MIFLFVALFSGNLNAGLLVSLNSRCKEILPDQQELERSLSYSDPGDKGKVAKNSWFRASRPLDVFVAYFLTNFSSIDGFLSLNSIKTGFPSKSGDYSSGNLAN